MILEVKHTKYADEFLEDVFDGCQETYEFPRELSGRTVIHIYPKEDTYDIEGQLHGFMDSYNCEIHIYNYNTGLVYKTKKLHDQIEFEVPVRVRSFKDLSTVIIVDKPIKLFDGQSLYICEVK